MRAAVADPPADFLEERCRDFVDAVASFEVRCHLRVGQRRFEARYQVCRADNLFVEAAHQFQRARVYQRDVRNLVVRRVLHRDLVVRLEHGFEVLPQLLPRRVLHLAAGQRVKMMALDAVYQLHRLALRRDQIKPAAGDHHGRRQAEHAISDGIAVMVIVEKPAFVAAVAQRSLDFRKIHCVNPL